MSELIEKAIRDAFPDAVLDSKDVFGVLNIKVNPEQLVPVCEALKSTHGFDYLEDLTSVDWKDRIEVVYQLFSTANGAKLAVRADLDRSKAEVDSVVSVWSGAEFQEREVYDLMGVVFKGNPDLRRILLPEDWEGHPLRKDYVIPD